ncbi:MAG: hypothetical protein R3D98_05975 [Candidatus Krumholzibacteriia bacterium]
MQTRRHVFSGTLALALALTILAATRAEAGLQVRVRVPGGVIAIRTPGRPVRVLRPLPALPAARGQVCMTRQDRQVARRLAQVSDVEMSELLRLRRLGYAWLEIGLWLELPRRTVVAALDADTWTRHQRSLRRLDHDRLAAQGPPVGHCVMENRDVRW